MDKKYILLAPEAIFPITKNDKGITINNTPSTGFKISGTIQGEGKMAGIPVLFIRTSRCNLRCIWNLPDGQVSMCDTPYTSFDIANELKLSVEKLKKIILNNLGNINHLVISGGEPLLQSENISFLISELDKERKIHYSVETNGTIYNEKLIEKIDFFSISPKLKNSVPTIEKIKKQNITVNSDIDYLEKIRLNTDVIQSIIDHCRENKDKDFQLKFVVQNHDEIKEIEDSFLSRLSGWKPDDIVLMPLGSTPEELKQTRMLTVELAIERGWRFSPRLQINYFGGIAGV
ncbi:MAG: 7-carboxy-7-deazaguanine synthase QueE [Prolixibacteraceae bacterium]|nr:7-carboxy-7-deazaguanine synthase QueE [Prolixibacteraceae bacterium]